MVNFKLHKLMATSLIALTMGVTSIQSGQRVPLMSRTQSNPSSESRTELTIPTNRLAAAGVYAALEKRADRNDNNAINVLKQFKRSDFQDVSKAKLAAEAYNNASKPNLTTQPSEENIVESLPMPSIKPMVQEEGPTMASKYKALAEKCLTMVDAKKQQYEDRIKALEARLGENKPEEHKQRDFLKEYEELYKKLLTGSANPKEEERLNQELGKLEREAEKAGVPLGEAAEKRDEAEKLKELNAHQTQARAALKKTEEDKDRQAYDTKTTWQPKLVGSQPLADELNYPDTTLFERFVSATMSLKIGAMIENESNENVLRALRHMVRKFSEKENMTQKQKNELSMLMNTIDLKLSNIGIKSSAQGAQGGNFTALPEDKEAYDKFQYVWSEAQKEPSSKLFKDINRIKNTDELIKMITSTEDNLSKITFNAVKLRSISFSKATLLELQAFKYTLSQVQTSSFNPSAVREITQTINNYMSILKKETPDNLKDRSQSEERIAAIKFAQTAHQAPGAPPPPKQAAVKETTTPMPPSESGGSWKVMTLTAGSEEKQVEDQLISEGVDPNIANEAGNAIKSKKNKLAKFNAILNVLQNRGVITNAIEGLKYKAPMDSILK